MIVISQELSPLYTRFHGRFAFSNTKGYNVFQMFRTFWLMGFIRVLDVYRDVPATFRQVGTMFTTPNWGRLFDGSLLGLGLGIHDYAVIAAGCAAMLTVSILQNRRPVRDRLMAMPVAARYVMFAAAVLLIFVFGAYGIGYDAGQFIYTRF